MIPVNSTHQFVSLERQTITTRIDSFLIFFNLEILFHLERKSPKLANR